MRWQPNLYCAPVKFAVQPDCRPPAKCFPGDTTVNPGGLQYKYTNCITKTAPAWDRSDLHYAFVKKESFHIREDTRNFLYTDKMEFHVIELPKLPDDLKKECTDLELWAKFINAERKEEFDMLAEKNIYIDSAYRKLQVISQDNEKRMEYEARQKAIRDYNEGLLEAEERGEQRGIQIGEQLRNIENARGMKNEGVSPDIISRVTGLSPAEIDSL